LKRIDTAGRKDWKADRFWLACQCPEQFSERRALVPAVPLPLHNGDVRELTRRPGRWEVIIYDEIDGVRRTVKTMSGPSNFGNVSCALPDNGRSWRGPES
jgi:hypothetical protein